MVDEKYLDGPAAVPWTNSKDREKTDKEGLDTPIPEPVEADPDNPQRPKPKDEVEEATDEKASDEGPRSMTTLS